jgi:hypothetical protein
MAEERAAIIVVWDAILSAKKEGALMMTVMRQLMEITFHAYSDKIVCYASMILNN